MDLDDGRTTAKVSFRMTFNLNQISSFFLKVKAIRNDDFLLALSFTPPLRGWQVLSKPCLAMFVAGAEDGTNQDYHENIGQTVNDNLTL